MNIKDDPNWNSDIFIAGDFNDWDYCKDKVDFIGGNYPIVRFAFYTYLPSGRYYYKLYQNGNWFIDPINPNKETDKNGNINSYVII